MIVGLGRSALSASIGSYGNDCSFTGLECHWTDAFARQ
jgi:hypothetical protein